MKTFPRVLRDPIGRYWHKSFITSNRILSYILLREELSPPITRFSCSVESFFLFLILRRFTMTFIPPFTWYVLLWWLLREPKSRFLWLKSVLFFRWNLGLYVLRFLLCFREVLIFRIYFLVLYIMCKNCNFKYHLRKRKYVTIIKT